MTPVDSFEEAPEHGEVWQTFVRSRFDTSNVHGAGRTAHVAALDRELATVEKEMATYLVLARKHRNAGILPCSLPAEVLTGVFFFASRLPDWQPGKIDGRFKAGWMHITHVCSVWRQVSLDAAVLWREIPCFQIARGAALPYFLRSKSLPLSLSFHCDSSANCVFLDADVLQAMSTWLCPLICRRIQHLTIAELGHRFQKRPWTSLLEQPMPNVEDLIIELTSSVSQHVLTKETLASTCPTKLRRLQLQEIALSWDSPIWNANLTTLSLAFSNTPKATALPSAYELRTILSRLSTLSELKLKNVFPKVDDGGADSDPLVLPETLSLVDLMADHESSPACLSLFLSLEIPAHTTCIINVNDTKLDQSVLLRSVAHIGLEDRLTRAIFLSTRCFLTRPDPKWLATDASSMALGWGGKAPQGALWFSSGLEVGKVAPAHLQSVISHMNWDTTTFLSLTQGIASVFASVPILHTVLAPAIQVDSLSIKYAPASFHLLSALATIDEESGYPSILPALSAVALYSDPSCGTGDQLRLYLALTELVRARQVAEAPIIRLFVDTQIVTGDEEKSLREFVEVQRMELV